jgi:hypothetical protein
MISQKIQDKRQKLLTQVQSENNKKKLVRKDNKILNVHINERKIKTANKFKIADLPHPFTSWEQYERSLQMPLGGEVVSIFLWFLVVIFICRGLERIQCRQDHDTAGDQDACGPRGGAHQAHEKEGGCTGNVDEIVCKNKMMGKTRTPTG